MAEVDFWEAITLLLGVEEVAFLGGVTLLLGVEEVSFFLDVTFPNFLLLLVLLPVFSADDFACLISKVIPSISRFSLVLAAHFPYLAVSCMCLLHSSISSQGFFFSPPINFWNCAFLSSQSFQSDDKKNESN